MKTIISNLKLILVSLAFVCGSVCSTVSALNYTDIYISPTGMGTYDSDNDVFVPMAQLDAAVVAMMYDGFTIADFCSDLFISGIPVMHAACVAVNISAALASQMTTMGISMAAGNYCMLFAACQRGSNFYYQLVRIVDASRGTINSVGVLSSMGLSAFNGMRLYFTGEVLEAYPGGEISADSSEGFIHIQGEEEDEVNIYLHNFKIYKVQDRSLGDMSMNDIVMGYLPGGASAFAICPVRSDPDHPGTSPFRANFHIKGDNIITGGSKRTSSSTGTIQRIFFSILDIASAPISIAPVLLDPSQGKSQFETLMAQLSFDDKWPTTYNVSSVERTNGSLKLPVTGEDDYEDTGEIAGDIEMPSIDLGNPRGTCVFDGGRYKLRCPASNSMFYVSSMAICYRMFNVMGIDLYGAGTSVSRAVSSDANSLNLPPEVVIYDGTFSTYSAEPFIDTHSIDVVSHAWYNDYDDLHFPYNTRIDGGSFNSNVYVCDASGDVGLDKPLNSAGDRLCRTTRPVSPGEISSLGTYTGTIDNYGSESLTPENGIINIYIPSGECGSGDVAYGRNWLTIIPKMGAAGILTMGGDMNVEYTVGTSSVPVEYSYLFYCNLNSYTKEYGTVTFDLGVQKLKVSIQDAIDQGGGSEFSSVTNTTDYTIHNGLYVMKSFETNKWYTLSMPYDVANIYVIETLSDHNWKDGGYTDLEEYLQAQGAADANLAQTIVTSLCPNILSGKGSGVKMSLIDISKNQLVNDKGLAVVPTRIYHYNPDWNGAHPELHTASAASYYLYEMDSLKTGLEDGYPNISIPDGFISWKPAATQKDFGMMWKYATDRTYQVNNQERHETGKTTDYMYYDFSTKETAPITPSDGIVMQRGVTYALYLPDGKKRFWDGKYLIFEGYGPQTMLGRGTYKPLRPIDEDDTWDDPTLEEQYSFILNDGVGMQANITFANDTVDSGFAVFKPQVSDKDAGTKFSFVRTTEEEMFKPGEVYAVLNKARTDAGATSITTTGAVSMPSSTTEAEVATDIPTVGDGKSLIAWSNNGICMHAFAEQNVSIYDINGQLIYSEHLSDGDSRYVPVAVGVYVLKGDNAVCKLVVQ